MREKEIGEGSKILDNIKKDLRVYKKKLMMRFCVSMEIKLDQFGYVYCFGNITTFVWHGVVSRHFCVIA